MITPQQFSELMNRYQSGTASETERAFIDQWYSQIGKDDVDYATLAEDKALEQKYLFALKKHMHHPAYQQKKTIIVSSWHYMGLAAAISLLVAAMIYLFVYVNARPLQFPADGKAEMMQVNNKRKHAVEITLPEGSHITLEPGSKVAYSKEFDQSLREIYLEGEAFFDVVKDAERPFLVYTNEVITKVVGTSFNIKAPHEGKEIVVSVSTGKVSVYTQEKRRDQTAAETFLIPNQKVTFNRQNKVLLRSLTANPLPLTVLQKIEKKRFTDEPIKEIFLALEKIYGVEIKINHQKFLNCNLTTTIGEDSLYERLDIICHAIGARYILEDTYIIIEGEGCN